MKTLVISSKEFAKISKIAKYELKGIVKSIFVAENILNKVAKGNADFVSSTITKDNFQIIARKCKELVTLQNANNKKYFDICLLPKNSKGVTCEIKHSKRCPKYGYDLLNVSESGWDYLVPVRLDAESLFNAFINVCKVDIKTMEKAAKVAAKIENEREKAEKAYNKNFRNAYKWIVGFEPKHESWGGGYEKDVHKNCINKDTGVVYECSGRYIYGFYWLNTSVSFDYDSFRKSEDKEQWIADFYAKCKEAALNRKAILTLKRIKAHTKEKAHSWDNDVYINNDYLRENTTDAEYAICSEFIRKQDKYFADEEARRRAEEIERLRREEEERKEREYMKQVKQEQIQECVERGADGMRDLWRKHLASVYDAEHTANSNGVDNDFFYYNGNVLLRMNLDKDKVETSKSIRMPIEVAKKFFLIIKRWHEKTKCFKPIDIDTKGSGRYTISSYENDILTAGCHKIAYTEMERMYNEIINA